MTDWSNVMIATQALVDPTTTSDDLFEIAKAHRSLWTELAAHPKSGTPLIEMLALDGDPFVRALAQVRLPLDSPLYTPEN